MRKKKTKTNHFESFNLTKREIQMLDYLTQNKSNREISEKLEISINTVKFHLKNIYKKLDINKRSQIKNIA